MPIARDYNLTAEHFDRAIEDARKRGDLGMADYLRAEMWWSGFHTEDYAVELAREKAQVEGRSARCIAEDLLKIYIEIGDGYARDYIRKKILNLGYSEGLFELVKYSGRSRNLFKNLWRMSDHPECEEVYVKLHKYMKTKGLTCYVCYGLAAFRFRDEEDPTVSHKERNDWEIKLSDSNESTMTWSIEHREIDYTLVYNRDSGRFNLRSKHPIEEFLVDWLMDLNNE